MSSNSIRSSWPLQYAGRVDWGAVGLWLLGFGLVAYLGLSGGGYDPLVHNQVGIAVWWILLATVLVGAIPRQAPSGLARVALGLLAAFVAWTALSLIWTESIDRTWADLARVLGYLGVFALAALARGADGPRRLVGAVAAGVVCVALVALLSRLHPGWFPAAEQTGRFVEGGRERLSYPLNYWNALAALIALGTPLLLQAATCARTLVLRAASAAALPALALTAFFTLSRGGIAAGIVALAVFLVFTSDRLPKLLTLLVAAAGGGMLVAAADQRDALRHGLLDATARHQGDEMLWMALLVCLGVGVIQAAIAWISKGRTWPAWTVPSRRVSQIALTVGLLAVIVAGLAAGVPSRASDAWTEFKEQGQPGHGADRLGSVAGEGRYEFWKVAARENESRPLTGTGSGTFEFWWTREGEDPQSVRDAHSLYMQTLGELGIVGLALLAALLLTILLGGGWLATRAAPGDRPPMAAALGGCAAFFATAIFDWMWQIPVLPVAMLLLGGGTAQRLRPSQPAATEAAPASSRRGALVGGDRGDRLPARGHEPAAPEPGCSPVRGPPDGAGQGAGSTRHPFWCRGAAPAGGARAGGPGQVARRRRSRPLGDQERDDQLAQLAGAGPDRSRARPEWRRGAGVPALALAEPSLAASAGLSGDGDGNAVILPGRPNPKGDR